MFLSVPLGLRSWYFVPFIAVVVVITEVDVVMVIVEEPIASNVRSVVDGSVVESVIGAIAVEVEDDVTKVGVVEANAIVVDVVLLIVVLAVFLVVAEIINNICYIYGMWFFRFKCGCCQSMVHTRFSEIKLRCSVYNPPLNIEWKYFVQSLPLYQTKLILKPDFVDVDGCCSGLDPIWKPKLFQELGTPCLKS